MNHRRLTLLVTIGISAVLMQCNYAGNQSGLHYFLDMHDNLAIEAGEEDYTTLESTKSEQYGADRIAVYGGPGSGMRVPPEGTVPRNYQPYPYEASEFDAAGKELRNPLPKTKAVLARGQKMYNVYCTPCHGPQGFGDGPVVPRFPAPPSLITGVTPTWEDGKIFHMITMGRGVMKPYAAQVKPEDRWAIVHYVRLLQAAGKANSQTRTN